MSFNAKDERIRQLEAEVQVLKMRLAWPAASEHLIKDAFSYQPGQPRPTVSKVNKFIRLHLEYPGYQDGVCLGCLTLEENEDSND